MHFVKNMKLLLFISILMISNICLAYINEPTGFRGIAWGASYDEVLKSGIIDGQPKSVRQINHEVLMCFATLADKKMCGLDVDGSVSFTFYNDRLYIVKVGLDNNNPNSEQNLARCQKAAQVMKNLFGSPLENYVKREPAQQFSYANISYCPKWHGDITEMRVEYFELIKPDKRDIISSEVFMMSSEISKEILKKSIKQTVKSSGF